MEISDHEVARGGGREQLAEQLPLLLSGLSLHGSHSMQSSQMFFFGTNDKLEVQTLKAIPQSKNDLA